MCSILCRDHEGMGFLALKSHPQTNQIFTLWQQGSIGEAQPSSKMSSD